MSCVACHQLSPLTACQKTCASQPESYKTLRSESNVLGRNVTPSTAPVVRIVMTVGSETMAHARDAMRPPGVGSPKAASVPESAVETNEAHQTRHSLEPSTRRPRP